MEFLEKQFSPGNGFILVPTGITSLAELIRSRIDLSDSFAIYHGTSLHQDDAPIVGHAGEYRGELLAPILSDPEDPYTQDEDGRRVHMLDPDDNTPKIIRVPTGIPLEGMRDSYRYECSLNKYFTEQSVGQILDGLRCEGWQDCTYTRERTGPMDFTPISGLRKNLRKG